MKLTQILLYGSVVTGTKVNKYYDDRSSRIPDWVKERNAANAIVTSEACNADYTDAVTNTKIQPAPTDPTLHCQKNRESWENSFPIEFTGSDPNRGITNDDRKTVIDTMKALYGNPEGRQTVQIPNKQGQSKHVWDFVEKVFYRDGDLFVIPAKEGYQQLMRFNNDVNKHTLFMHTGSNDYNDANNQKLEGADIDQKIPEHMRYGQDFCNFLSGSKFDSAIGEMTASPPTDKTLGQSVIGGNIKKLF